MSEREKKLLYLFAVAGVILLGFWGFSTFQTYKLDLTRKLDKAKGDLETAKMAISSRDAIIEEIEWLTTNEPQPRASLQVPGEMEKLADTEALRSGMSVKNKKILPTLEAGTEGNLAHYSIAQVEFQVTGTEEKLYNWFYAMHDPEKFRAISNISLMPNKEDDTLIDCNVIFDQWFIAASLDSAEPEPASTP
jgi:hypothetical protein